MPGVEQELKLVVEEVAEIQRRRLGGLQGEAEIDRPILELIEDVAGVARNDRDVTAGEAFAELPHDGGEDVLADGQAGAHAQAAAAPAAQALEFLPGLVHLPENGFSPLEKLLARLGECYFFTNAIN